MFRKTRPHPGSRPLSRGVAPCCSESYWGLLPCTGAGLLFGLGIFILLGGGICIMALSHMSRQI
ncbi:hypothetical protein J2T22_001917 [Pseudarthrobacter defluvii]|uniref:Uncharacterized protein n=1 Tax=Pseudarthrobacter defluvii TaxID=410837 RepID=A0ABT9UGF7_9MICC|nr:hypothetical protein [Pseudarthrobacter defluvii]